MTRNTIANRVAKLRDRTISVLLLLIAATVATAAEPTYPGKPIRIVAPAPPGGGTDFLARFIGQQLSERLGQPAIVDNRPGANGNIGSDVVAKAAPDGYTLLMTYAGTHTINPSLYRTMTWDPIKDFSPISRLVSYTYIVVVNSTVPAKSLQEFVALAKAKPNTLSYGSAGPGSGGHLVGALFMMASGTHIVHIPYKGSGPAIIDLLAGRLDVMFDTVNNVRTQIESGKLRPLAVAGDQRLSAFPSLPTTSEAGFPEVRAVGWYGLLTTGGTPKEIVAKLNAEVVKIMAEPAVAERMRKSGYEPATNTPEQFAAFIETEISKWGRVVKASGAQLD